MEILRVAMAQINPLLGDLAGNQAKIINYINQAKKIRADIVTFPELALTGYPPEDLLLKKYFIRDNIDRLKEIEKYTKDITVIIGFVDMNRRGRVFNAAAIIHDGRTKAVYHKIELPNYGVFDEKRYFEVGESPLVFGLGSVLFAVNICEDIWKKKGVAKLQSENGARIIINISASPYYAGKGILRKKMLIERAKETKAYICYNNMVGGQDELVFDGNSFMLSPKGRTIVSAKQFKEDLVIADLSINIDSKVKTGARHIRFIHLSNLKDIKKPSLPEIKYKQLDRINEIYSALVLGTGDYIKKNGFKKVVIGLSGGIDSSLTAVIARDAIGKDNVIGISMPSRYSSVETQFDAKRLADNLGIKLIVVPIDSIFKMYMAVLENHFVDLQRDITEENLQARIRGNILMAFSNKFGWLVLTTGNKSEVSVGYCTLYGDTAGGFAVIKDVPKMLVYELARFVNERQDRCLIPESVFRRAPSAELKPDQKDQDSLPPYSILDRILRMYVQDDKSVEDIISLTKSNPDIVRDVVRKVDRNEYKRRQSPPGIKITPRAFGKDRRLPITNRYTE